MQRRCTLFDFKLNKNELGLDSFSLSFDNKGCIFKYQQVNKKGEVIKSEFRVGNNGEYKITSTKYRPTYFEVDKDQFPDYIPAGLDKLFINNRLFFQLMNLTDQNSILLHLRDIGLIKILSY